MAPRSKFIANPKKRPQWRHRSGALSAIVVLLALNAAAAAQDKVATVEVTSNVFVFSTAHSNVVASVGPDGALMVGTPSASSTATISKFLKEHTSSPARYLVVSAENPTESDGDAGWGRLGAFVAMQEKALQRLGGNRMGAPGPLPERFKSLGVDRPRVAFSGVLAFDLNAEAIHIIHQKSGYSDADAITHFHVANLVYFGEVFPGDGYPIVDQKQGGALSGILGTLEGWTDSKLHVVPARGAITNGKAVQDFRDMIIAVRDRIKAMIAAGKTQAQIVSEHPTSDFDGRWGHGRVSPETFVHEVYSDLISEKESQDKRDQQKASMSYKHNGSSK